MTLSFTVVSCHFGDPFWATQLAERLNRHSPQDVITELLIVNQDRVGSSDWIHKLPQVRQVVSYPAIASEFQILGHDHPSSLNRVLREKILTTHVIVMDSDCFPISENWFGRLINLLATTDCVLAGDSRTFGLTHPCFMAMPTSALGRVDFSAGIEIGVDTGRLVGFQLSQAGYKVNILQPETGFEGYAGDLYLYGTILHVGSASFSSSQDSRLLSQVDRKKSMLMRRYVQDDRFHLNLQDKFRLKYGSLIRRIGNK